MRTSAEGGSVDEGGAPCEEDHDGYGPGHEGEPDALVQDAVDHPGDAAPHGKQGQQRRPLRGRGSCSGALVLLLQGGRRPEVTEEQVDRILLSSVLNTHNTESRSW